MCPTEGTVLTTTPLTELNLTIPSTVGLASPRVTTEFSSILISTTL